MSNVFCFIPTKKRIDTNTYKLFDYVGIKVYHFIEPQEFDIYQVPNKINIGENNKGITFVRNFMLKKDTEWAVNIVKKYHPFAKLQKKGDRIDAKIDISGFAKSLNKIVK